MGIEEYLASSDDTPSDTDELRAWQHRIERRLEHNVSLGEWEPAIYRPHEAARRALRRIGLEYPQVMQVLDSHLATLDSLSEGLQGEASSPDAGVSLIEALAVLADDLGVYADELASRAVTRPLATDTEPDSTKARYLGNGKVALPGDTSLPIVVTKHLGALEYLVENQRATTSELEQVVSNPSKSIRELREVEGGALAPFIHRPKAKGQGYTTTIIDARNYL